MYKRTGSMLVKKDLAPQMLNTRSSLHVTTFLIRPKLSLYFHESFLCHMQTFFSYNSLFSFSHQCLHQHKKFKIVFFPFLWYFFLYNVEKFMEYYTINRKKKDIHHAWLIPNLCTISSTVIEFIINCFEIKKTVIFILFLFLLSNRIFKIWLLHHYDDS